MLESILRALIPRQLSEFAKLTGGDPYHFDSWSNDRGGLLFLYYWFWARDQVSRNKKRVPVPEIRAALRVLRDSGVLTVSAFRNACPVAASAGLCGFAVTGRIFEALGVAEYEGHSEGFRLINVDETARLLGPTG